MFSRAEEIQNTINKIYEVKNILGSLSGDFLDEHKLIDKLNISIESLKSLNRKPVIGFFGQFDTGKSTLINTLISDGVLPTSYQPSTNVINILMHESDRPEYMHKKVAIFRKGFRPYMIKDKSLVDKHLIIDGGEKLLSKLGAHDYEDMSLNEAYIAIIFSEAKVLESAWLLDTPGSMNESVSDDTEKALSGIELVDGIVFLSRISGFLSDSELYYFSEIIQHHPPINENYPLNHILLVLSHCHSEISLDQVEQVKKVACLRSDKYLENLVFRLWKIGDYIKESPAVDDVRNRVLPFWRESQSYCEALKIKITLMSKYLSENQNDFLMSDIDRVKKELIDDLERAMTSI